MTIDVRGIDVRGIDAGELEALSRVCFTAFGEHPTAEQLEDEATVVEVDRMVAVTEGGSFVGSAGAYSFDLTVPGGGQLPVAGVTWVGVLPTHRRRGVLNAMMAFQLDDVAARGEAVAVLTASEASIYGRFGYGVAARLARVALDTTHGLDLQATPDPGGRLRLVTDAEQHSAMAAPVYDQVRRGRVGELSRPEPWWTMLQRDREKWRDDFSARFCVVHEADDGTVDGFCWYRVKDNWGDDAVPRGTVKVWELAAETDEVEAALLHYLASIDLTGTVEAWRPVDDPWAYRLADGRRYRVKGVHDHLYARLLDVPTALAARTYGAAGTITLDVDDAFRPSAGGRFRLQVADDGTATCERVGGDRPADLSLDASALGSLYLGDVAPWVLAASGRLRPASPAVLDTADRLFPASRKPFCTSEF